MGAEFEGPGDKPGPIIKPEHTVNPGASVGPGGRIERSGMGFVPPNSKQVFPSGEGGVRFGMQAAASGNEPTSSTGGGGDTPSERSVPSQTPEERSAQWVDRRDPGTSRVDPAESRPRRDVDIPGIDTPRDPTARVPEIGSGPDDSRGNAPDAHGDPEEQARKAEVRTAGLKVLLTRPSWDSEARKLRHEHGDEIFTDEEREFYAEEAAKDRERAWRIEAEIEEGTSPWLAHSHHNEQGPTRPYAIGFSRGEDGTVKTLFGERFFQSVHGNKQVHLLDTASHPVDEPTVLRGDHWDALPEDLRAKIEGGEILVTGGKDLYDLSDEDIANIGQSGNPGALQEHVDEKIRTTPEGYYFLHYSDYGDGINGRTGVLLQAQGGEMKPVVTTIDGQEYILEMKGSGTKYGGFGPMHERAGWQMVTGGADQEEALTEFARLQESTGDGPKAVGSVTFGEDEGWIARLSPATTRASFRGPDAYPNITHPDMVERVTSMYADQLAEQISGPQPYIMSRSSHTENLLLWGDGNVTYTDYSDHKAFSEDTYPVDYHPDTGYTTPFNLLQEYLEGVEGVPGYSQDVNEPHFRRELVRAFAKRGRDLELSPEDNFMDIADHIWEEGGMAYEIYRARHENGYTPTGVLEVFGQQKGANTAGIEGPLESEVAFTDRYTNSLTDIERALWTLHEGATEEDRIRIERTIDSVSQGSIIADASHIDAAASTIQTSDLPDATKQKGIEASGFLKRLNASTRPLDDYLRHELHIMDSAYAGAPIDQMGELDEARAEAVRKYAELADTRQNPSKLYALLTDSDAARKLVTFDAYTKRDGSEA